MSLPSHLNLQVSSLSSIDHRQAPAASTRYHTNPLATVAERLLAGGLLLLASPPLLASAGLIALLSRRSPFVAHLRVGRAGVPLWLLKLRTMWGQHAPVACPGFWIERIDAEPGIEPKRPGDPRVTSRFAAFCRKHSIDELPQLWQVVRGELALIGPRPVTHGELYRLYGADAGVVLGVRPGLSGLWQVNGRSTLSLERRKTLDLFLVRNRSCKLWIAILLKTVGAVWSGKGAS